MLFAVHPLRVESVAWATERRDVLCGLFYLLTVLVYLRACAAGPAGPGLWRQRRYWAAVGLAALAVLSRSMAVTVPVVLLVLDVYPLRRLGGGWEGWLGAGARRVWLEKAPFVAISGAASVGALAALDKGIIPIDQVSAVDRAAISVYSLALYLWTMVVPVNLSPLYGLPARIEPLSWPYVVAVGVVAAMSAAAFLLRSRCPGLAAVWVCYVVILLPVVGIVQNGWQIAADRYTYRASSGWALLAGAGLGAWCAGGGRRLVHGRRAVVLAGAEVIGAVALGTLTWQQVQVWHDPRSLWTHALATHPSAVAHYNLGVFIARQGERTEAVRHYRRAVALKPEYAEAQNNLGAALLQQGDAIEATEPLRRAAALKPDLAEPQYNLGLALERQGALAEAVAHYRRAVALKPDYAEAQNNLGAGLIRQGDLAGAAEHFRRAVALRPADAEAQNNLGVALERQGRPSEAIEHFRRALSIRPDFREAQTNLDLMLAGRGPAK